MVSVSGTTQGEGGLPTVSGARRTLAFVVATCCLLLPFAAGAAPIPLYGTYVSELGLAQHNLSVATMWYFAGTLSVLLVLGRLSTYLGRRPVIALDLALAAAGCLLFARVGSAGGLYAARFVQGLSCGLAAGCAGAYAVDTAPERPRWLASAVNTSGAQVGFAVGALGSAALFDQTGGDLQLPFHVLAVGFVVLIVLVALCPETMARQGGALRSLVPHVEVAASARGTLVACLGCFMGAWGMSGFFQTFSSTFARSVFDASDAMVGAAIFTAYMLPGIVGGPLSGRLRTRVAVRAGIVGLAAAIALMAAAVVARAGALLVGAIVVAGVAQALAYAGGLASILAVTSQRQAAGTLSTVTLASYVGALVPNLVIGALGGGWSTEQVSAGYAVLMACYCAATLVLTRAKGWPRAQASF